MFEEEKKEDDEVWIDWFDNSKIIYDEEREEYNRDGPSDSKDKWEKTELKLKGYSFVLLKPTH
jgi:predicted 3-demethylubiquinone-9 3-methyltransferase (glyoxalase superfamily)